MRKAIGLIAMLVILAIGVLASLSWPTVWLEIDDQVVDAGDVLWGSDVLDADPLPVTEFVEKEEVEVVVDFPKQHHLQIIGRLAEGIVKYKNGSWWECGNELVGIDKIEERALFYAYEIVRAADEVSDGEEKDDPKFALNPWGLAGVIRNESQFDRCALGTHPRKTAYHFGLIKKQKRCISHTEEEVLAAVQSENMQVYYKRTGFDLGTAQLLSRFYSNPRDYKFMLSVRGGTSEAAFNMRKRGRMYKTKRPWLYWRGYKCDWYDEKITRWAKQLGARSDEI